MEWLSQEALLPPDPSPARLHGLCRPHQLSLVHGASSPSAGPQHVAAVPRGHHAVILHLHGAQGLFDSGQLALLWRLLRFLARAHLACDHASSGHPRAARPVHLGHGCP